MLRKVFGPKRDEVIGEWRKIEKNEMGGACGSYKGGERCAQGSRGET